MSHLWQLTGIDAAAVPPGAHPRVEWLGLPEGAAALLALCAAAALLATVVLLYRRERTAARGARLLACAARILVLGVLAVMLLEPSVAFDVMRVRPGKVIFLADSSASMGTVDSRLSDEGAHAWADALGLAGPDDARRMSRHELLRAALAGSRTRLVERCRARNAVTVMTFDEAARPLLDAPRLRRGATDAAFPSWEPLGSGTDVAGAVMAALHQGESAPLAAIVVLSDGRQTLPGSIEDAARAAAARRVPVHCICIGDPREPRNAAVVDVLSEDHATLGAPLRLQVVVRASGLAGGAAELTVEEEDIATGQRVPVAKRSITLGPDGVLQRIDVTHEPQRRGEMRYSARLAPLEGESRLDDNTAARRVTVLDERVRVLLVAAAPSFEYRFLSAMLERDAGFELSVWLQSRQAGVAQGGKKLLEGLPATREAALSYDVVALLDPAPDGFGAEWMEMLSALVGDRGGGLVYVAGLAHTPEFLARPELKKMGALLPVVIDPARARALGGAAHTEAWPVSLTREGAGHLALRVGDDQAATEAFWRAVPGLYWACPVERAKPGATVLLRYRNPSYRQRMDEDTVLAAVQPYGAGATLFLGCDETWRWRAAGISQHHRFWSQVLRYVVRGRSLGGRKRANIALDRASYRLGEPVRVQARLFDSDFRPLVRDEIQLGVEHEGVRTGAVTLRPLGAQQGIYEGVFYPERFGQFDVVYKPDDMAAVREGFRVERPERELDNVAASEGALRGLAELSGGAYVGPAALARLPELIPDATVVTVDAGEPQPLWDAGWLMCALIVLLAGEWVLRKRMGGL